LLRVAIERYTATTILHYTFYNLVVLTSFLLGFAVTAATSKRRQSRRHFPNIPTTDMNSTDSLALPLSPNYSTASYFLYE
jgi:hypothetical protein